MVSKEAEFCDLQSYREFVFFNFRIMIKITPSEIFSFLGKKISFLKKMYSSETKVKLKKKLCIFVEDEIPLRLIYVSTVKVEPFDQLVRYSEPPFFTFSVNTSFYEKKMEKNS